MVNGGLKCHPKCDDPKEVRGTDEVTCECGAGYEYATDETTCIEECQYSHSGDHIRSTDPDSDLCVCADGDHEEITVGDEQ